MVFAGGFIAVGEHEEGGVVTVGFEDAVGFDGDPAVDGLSIADGAVAIGPRGAFDLEVEAQFIGCGECGFRGAPGVEAHMIQAMGFAGSDDTLPGVGIGGWVAGEGEDGAFEGAAEECGGSVDGDLGADGMDLAQAEGCLAAIHIAP